MLRIIDARTGEPAPAAPARRAPTRVEAHVPGHDATALRVLLVADLLVRVLELDSTPAWAVLTGAAERDGPRKDAAALGIRPFEDGTAGPGPGPGSGQSVRVVSEGEDAGEGEDEGGDEPGVATVAVASVHPAVPDLADPDAVRLALLERHHHAPVELDATALDEARATLAGLRGAVADWARQPSRPVPGELRDRLRAAWEDDLDAPGVLRVLRRVATDPDLPDGARFETFAYADRFLGLHLTRDVGSPP
ncbi:hypothetical protein ACN6LC_006893 [Streptomyces violaceoruber]|uniref:hypothetical protein n=1 Tax=Streptomyces TaxID=1883 RepID=UPI00030B120C|nr:MULTISPECIES: hypothetical protein [Streptomyces]MDX2923409.1 hypothetical protein [Streptomyces sp. NRRL_B-16638]NSL80757.1 hypothetical protein [Streptomyces coelicolor]QKN65172.1 hypothetical protein HCU77_06340 [Streptomyces coelicolor]TYP10131.1 hypothetical protein FHV91_10692 [Streptomyces coelicolor]TYP14213.1 hypothetical protein FHV98_10692 [Streptomyces coelicolor A3(2)]